MATKTGVKYAVVDAFADAPFKGNPAAVCFLEADRDDQWMQSVATEFNLSETAFLTRAAAPAAADSGVPRFHLRWFTPVQEVNLCGHATLAAAYFLLSSGLTICDLMEFVTKSGVLMAKKINNPEIDNAVKLSCTEVKDDFFIELDFPVVPVVECDSAEALLVAGYLKGVSIVSVQKTATDGDLLVELASGSEVADMQPKFDELEKCPGRGIIVTGQAPPGSRFDFFTRFFCPKLGINEDPVTGSIHCALAPYWSKKLEKHNLIAYQVSPRGGRLELKWEEQVHRVRIKGKAVTVMLGTLVCFDDCFVFGCNQSSPGFCPGTPIAKSKKVMFVANPNCGANGVVVLDRKGDSGRAGGGVSRTSQLLCRGRMGRLQQAEEGLVV